MKYRREIDGLRALAVVPVILFHAGFKTFSGGFVGVDVFFVISGYLITTILLDDLEKDKFSIINFYERRARRILPALFVVMFTCLPFAWLWLVPRDMKSFSQSLVAVSTFASNILFWHQSGYFDTASELKPLLHTWSLAVEEQYYVFFPLFLLLTWRLGKQWIVSLLALAFILSLATAQWESITKPSASFFLLPTRAWELIVGVFVSFYFDRKHKHLNFSHSVNQSISTVGFLLIVYSTFAFDSTTPFPGLYALVPTIGAAFIILCARPHTLVGDLLGSKVFVGVGLISYGAYLWHQPLFAFARQRDLNEPNHILLATLSVLSLLLAYMTWKFIETPFRDKLSIQRAGIFIFSLTGSFIFIGIGLSGHLTNGFRNRLSPDRAAFLDYFDISLPRWHYFVRMNVFPIFRSQCNFYNLEKYRTGNSTNIPIDKIADECHIQDRSFHHSVLIWGDSHAEQLYPGIKKYISPDWQILQITSSGCAAKLNATPNRNSYCNYSNWFAVKTINETKPDVVVIGQDSGHDVKNMISIAGELKNIGVKKVIFTGPTPHWSPDLPVIVAYKLWDKTPQRTYSGIDKAVIDTNSSLKKDFKQSKHLRFVSIIDNFCDTTGCLIFTGDDKKTGITSIDYGHLTYTASQFLAKNVLVNEIENDF